jgi:photosystem II stability/assembly factor-like uncharacterized protein
MIIAKGQQGWQYQNSNLTTNFLGHGAIFPINKDTVFVIADSSKFLKTYNGGTNWILQNTGFSKCFFDLSFINADTGYAVGQNGTIIKTTNGGTNWIALTTGTNADLFSISIKAPNNLWVVGDSGVILNSCDYGISWVINDTLTDNKLNSICFRNSSIGFIAGNSGTLFGTINGGINWDTLNIATTKDLYSLTVTDNYAYLLAGSVMDYFFNSNELFKTNDDINWTSYYIGSTPGPSKLYFRNDSLGFTIASDCIVKGTCEIVIKKTTDFGQNWMYSLTSYYLPNEVGIGYSDLFFVTDSIGYAYCGNYILKTTDGGILVNVNELEYCKSLKIYPNPTTGDINLQIPQQFGQTKTLEVFDCIGQKQFEKTNDFTDIDISSLTSGLYFIVLTNKDNERQIVKIIKE